MSLSRPKQQTTEVGGKEKQMTSTDRTAAGEVYIYETAHGM